MIEEASVDDAEEILSVINTSNREAYRTVIPREHFKDPVMSLGEILRDFERLTWYVYKIDQRIVATGGLSVEGPERGRIHLVYILPEYQRRGIGTTLVSYLEDRAREMGLKRVRLLTVKKASWAIKFYEKLGYSVTEEIDRLWGHDVWMEKELEPGRSDG